LLHRIWQCRDPCVCVFENHIKNTLIINTSCTVLYCVVLCCIFSLMCEPGTCILGKYVIRECIGSGAFGEVWSAETVNTGELVAVKMERIQNNPAPTLQYESRVLQLFQNIAGIPRLRYFGRNDDMNRIFMVTELLGPSLEKLAISQRMDMPADIAKNPPQPHSDFITRIGRQMLQRLQYIHTRGMLHRDVKPDNFLFARTPVLDMSRRAGLTPNPNVPLLYLIDFGMAKRIEHGVTASSSGSGSGTKTLIGSPRYASIFAHRGEPLGRRDDLISMMYSLIYVANGGGLPWMGYSESEAAYIKESMTPTELCAELCDRHKDDWADILDGLYCLKAGQTPDYAWIESML
jgi:serine/threonine protein kinase